MKPFGNQHLVQKGELKTIDIVFKNRDTISGKRKVRIDDKTEIYTRFNTDEEAIANFYKLHKKWQTNN